MTRLLSFSMTAIVLLLSCQPAPGPTPRQTDLRDLLPSPSSLAPWGIAESPVEYSPDTLYEVLDGAAPLYLKHGFRRLLQVRYQRGEESQAGVTLGVFDMGSALGAFGIYSSARPLAADFHQWGAEGYRFANVAAAWKGNLYVHGEADDDQPELLAIMERLIAQLCDGATGTTSPPTILGLLPAQGLVPRSERVVAADLLSHEFLPGGVLASYDIDGRRGELFFSDLTSAAAAAQAIEALHAHYSRWAQILPDKPATGAGGFTFQDPALGLGVVSSIGRFVAGVHGDLPKPAQERLLAQLAANLRGA